MKRATWIANGHVCTRVGLSVRKMTADLACQRAVRLRSLAAYADFNGLALVDPEPASLPGPPVSLAEAYCWASLLFEAGCRADAEASARLGLAEPGTGKGALCWAELPDHAPLADMASASDAIAEVEPDMPSIRFGE